MSSAGHGRLFAMHGLLPVWLELLGVVGFGLIALSHLRHMIGTDGQRRSWHTCHVMMATAMAFMYAPGAAAHLVGVTAVWRVVLAAAGLLAALWAVWGAAERLNPVWLLTALDLGAMLLMFSPHPRAVISATVVLYLLADAAMWTLDAHRGLERESSLLAWLPLGDPSGGTLAVDPGEVRAGSLLGELDIGASMVLMSLGMAYMVLAMAPFA